MVYRVLFILFTCCFNTVLLGQKDVEILFQSAQYDSLINKVNNLGEWHDSTTSVFFRTQVLLAKSYQLTDNREAALAIFLHLRDFAIAASDTAKIIECYIHIGEYFRYIDKIPLAKENLEEAKNLLENSRTNLNLNILFYSRYVAVLSAIDNTDPDVERYIQLGLAKAIEAKNTNAIAGFQAEMGFQLEVMASLKRMGKIKSDRDFTLEAKEMYLKALNNFENQGNFRSMLTIYENLARTVHHAGQFENSLVYSNQAIATLIDKVPITSLEHLLYFNYQSNKLLGRFEASLAAIEQYLEAYRIRTTDEWDRSRELDELDFEVEIKEILLERKEELLQLQSAQIETNARNRFYLILIISLITMLLLLSVVFWVRNSRSNRKLKALNTENQFLVEESNHRIKNNLQLIISLIQRELSKESEHRDIDGLVNISSKIESIASLHKQLYINPELDEIDIKTYIEDVLLNMKDLFVNNKVEVEKDLESFKIKHKSAVYFGLLLTELCINSLKHAFDNQDKPKISIKIHFSNSKLCLEFQDNGIGFSKGKYEPILACLLGKQIGGELQYSGDKGFFFSLIKKL